MTKMHGFTVHQISDYYSVWQGSKRIGTVKQEGNRFTTHLNDNEFWWINKPLGSFPNLEAAVLRLSPYAFTA